MNIVVQELSKKQNLQDLLIALLGDVQKYFKTIAPTSEQKTHAIITTIFTRISRNFPLIYSIPTLAKRLSNDLREKVNDSVGVKKKESNLKAFMKGIRQEDEQLSRGISQQSQENKNIWIKKMLLQGINQLKQDIKDADLLAEGILKAKLQRTKGKELPTAVFIDSFLTNSKVVQSLIGYQIRNVVSDQIQLKSNQIHFTDAARVLRQSRFLIISADSVLRNGGILSKSGSLMLAILAHQLHIPVIAISRSYCLSEEILLSQESLVNEQSGKNYFPGEQQNVFRVLIAKKYDFIEPKLINTLIGEIKGWQSQSIAEIFQEYYR